MTPAPNRHEDSVPVALTTRPLVLVADSQRLFTQALSVALARRGNLSAAPRYPTTTEEAVEAAVAARPDAVVLDLWIPGRLDALGATELILIELPRSSVLHLTWIYGVEHLQASLDSGAAGLLPKALNLEQVAQAVHRAIAGERPVYGDEIQRVVTDIARRSLAAEHRRAAFAELSAREVEVLRLLAEGHPARELPQRLMVSAGTMRNYIHRINKKLGVHTQQDAVRVARHQGLIPPTRGRDGA